MPTHDARPIPPLDTLRNQIAIGADSMMFTIGMYFMPVTTVLSALTAGFTSDKTLIGMISLAWYVGWLAPQLWAARLVRGKARMRRYALLPAALGRPMIFLLALWLWFDRGQSPSLSVWLIILGVTIFTASDGVTATAGWDMIGRALSPRIRSRVLTVNSFLAAIGGLGAGVVVERVLASDLPFPLNYAVLLAVAFVFYMLALLFMAMIEERPAGVGDGRRTIDDRRPPTADGRRTTDGGRQQTDDSRPPIADGRKLAADGGPPSAVGGPESERTFVQHLLHSVRTDAVFRRILAARVLVGIENMAAAFYVVFAREQLKLPESAVGVFSIAIVVGGLIGIAAFGWTAMRFGSRRVIQAAGVMQFTAPVIALLAAIGVAPPSSFVALLVVIMALNGAVSRSTALGYFSYTQDAAAEVDRPMYIGAMSSVAGVAALMPLLGGLLIDGLQRTGAAAAAYPSVFALAALSAGVGVALTLGLPRPRRGERG